MFLIYILSERSIIDGIVLYVYLCLYAICYKDCTIKSGIFSLKEPEQFIYFFYENHTNRGVNNDRRPNATTKLETSVGQVCSVKSFLE